MPGAFISGPSVNSIVPDSRACRASSTSPAPRRARVHPDAHPSLPDAVPRLCRRPGAARLAAHAHLADGGGAHAAVAGGRGPARRRGAAAGRHDRRPDDGDGARHRRGVRGAGADRPARRRRQVHDGRRPTRCRRGCSSRRGVGSTRAVGAGARAGTARANGRLRAAFAPRFAVSCSRELLEAVAALVADARLLVHTHASEKRDEIALVAGADRARQHRLSGRGRAGLAAPVPGPLRVGGRREQALLAEHDVKVLHCPGSNLKLGSGIAPVVEMRARGVSVSLGADGARLQQPPRHVRRDAAGGHAAGRAVRARRAHRPRRAVDGDPRGRPRAGPQPTIRAD